MTSVLHLVNDVSSTSIPLDIAGELHAATDLDVKVAAFYASLDSDGSSVDDFDVPITPLGGRSRFDMRSYSRLRRLLSDVDVLHTHQNFVGSVARVVAATTDVDVVNTEHQNHGSFSPLQNAVNAPTLPLADRIVANSERTRDSFRWYERLLLGDDRVTVIYNGIDVQRIEDALASQPTQSSAGDDDTVRIVSVGRLVPVKNYRTLVEAFAKAADQDPTLELVLVGDGPERSELEELTASLGVDDSVEFTGFVSRAEVYRRLATSDLFAICSHSEGFCVAAVEAMAVGLPVVVSDIDVFREVVGSCGRFVPPTSTSEFASTFVELAGDREQRERDGSACKRRSRSRFSLDETVRRHVALYEDVVQVNLSQ
jgi:glycosyltransferase involved in cell wall biosynthesis